MKAILQKINKTAKARENTQMEIYILVYSRIIFLMEKARWSIKIKTFLKEFLFPEREMGLASSLKLQEKFIPESLNLFWKEKESTLTKKEVSLKGISRSNSYKAKGRLPMFQEIIIQVILKILRE